MTQPFQVDIEIKFPTTGSQQGTSSGKSERHVLTTEDGIEQALPGLKGITYVIKSEGLWIGSSDGRHLVIPFGAVQMIGDTQLRVGHIQESTVAGKAKEEKSSPVVLLGGIGMIVALLVMIGGEEDKASGYASPRHFPELFAYDPSCPAGDPSLHAKRKKDEAEAKFARYAFAPEDGVKAALAAEQAANCYVKLGNNDEAVRLMAFMKRVQTMVKRDYLMRRLRLEHALKHKQKEEALMNAQLLLRMMKQNHVLKGDGVKTVEYLEQMIKVITNELSVKKST